MICRSLFSTGPKLENFCAKKFYFWFKPLVALLVAFTAADKFFQRLHEADPKRTKKRCWPYTSLFSDLNTNLLKYRTIRCRKISVLCAKVQSILVPPAHFRLVPPHFGCSGDGTAHQCAAAHSLETLV